jgi:hypothetical protein
MKYDKGNEGHAMPAYICPNKECPVAMVSLKKEFLSFSMPGMGLNKRNEN